MLLPGSGPSPRTRAELQAIFSGAWIKSEGAHCFLVPPTNSAACWQIVSTLCIHVFWNKYKWRCYDPVGGLCNETEGIYLAAGRWVKVCGLEESEWWPSFTFSKYIRFLVVLVSACCHKLVYRTSRHTFCCTYFKLSTFLQLEWKCVADMSFQDASSVPVTNGTILILHCIFWLLHHCSPVTMVLLDNAENTVIMNSNTI